MLTSPKIITPRYCREATFALDLQGSLPQDSCIVLVPRPDSMGGWQSLRNELGDSIGRSPSQADVLMYCLAFLNSTPAERVLTEGRRRTAKGSFTISESSLEEVRLPMPKGPWAAELLDLVIVLCGEPSGEEVKEVEGELGRLTQSIAERRE